jgi:hypothetical protein
MAEMKLACHWTPHLVGVLRLSVRRTPHVEAGGRLFMPCALPRKTRQ